MIINIWPKKDQFIIDLYEEWGTLCVDYIDTDFSFVLYDPHLESYFLARDVMGTKPLYYTVKDGKLFYSNDIGELFLESIIKKEPNFDALSMLMHYDTVPYDATLYLNIKRLPPGHSMTVDKYGEVNIERYWKPETIKINNSISEEDAKKKFLKLFDQAISDRIDDISTTGFELSGGLDSSSIVSRAHQIFEKETIYTISKTYKTLPKCDESEYIDSMNYKENLDIYKVNVDNLDYKDKYSLEFNYKLNSYWPIIVTFTTGFAIAENLQEMGIKKVFTGQGGDEIMTGNTCCIRDYFKHFQWIQTYREIKTSKYPALNFKRYILLPLLSKNQKSVLKWVLEFLHIKKAYSTEQIKVPKKSFKEFGELYTKEPFALKCNVNALVSSSHSLYTDHSYYNVVEKNYDIEFTHPFFDRRLIEFMLSLPNKFKYREGITKILLRKAMKGILPEKIRLRNDKAEFSEVLKQQIDALDLDVLLNDSMIVKLGLIEQREIDQLKEEFLSGKMVYVRYFWKVINMEYWYTYNFGTHEVKEK